MTTATSPLKPNFKRNLLLQILVAWYLIIWIGLAIAPLYRSDWLLENILVFVTVAVLVFTYRWFPLSDVSYLLITLFLTLHAIGAHYTYEKVPLGFWLQDAFNLSRNHFDRIVHFSFGFLLGYPLRELLLRVTRTNKWWIYFLTVNLALSGSSFFELLESWVAQIVSPELGVAYLGTQGDEWDAQKDMTLALVGVLLCLGVVWMTKKLAARGFINLSFLGQYPPHSSSPQI
jgi:putative membrane protein